MQEENFSPQDSLKLIQTMIAKTRRDMGDNRNQFLLWGWITFTAFIEPKASALLGGGNGEAMLVVGSKRCLSVYDLISMKVMWSIEGWFSSFAVAPDEAAAISCATSESRDRDRMRTRSKKEEAS